MPDIMRPVPFKELLNRMFKEYANEKAIFGYDEQNFFKDDLKHHIKVFGQRANTPIGPAAGPHTQLAQNIIVSYLAGGRFMELKTVQILDTLEVEKPCIDARDECYNCEWSTEYTLEKAHDEYIKAWVILHIIENLMLDKVQDEPQFIFNMSVGYNMEGILTDRMQAMLDRMTDSTNHPKFIEYLSYVDELANNPELLKGTPWYDRRDRLVGLSKKISGKMARQITLSTMHGCPPKEIEAICSYMLDERKINTFVKLNPTLLGYDKVRKTLDELGYDYLHLNPEAFSHDLQYADAKPMLHRLVDLSKKNNLTFGVKLTNTLGSVNDQGHLPGPEMYMSGRALLPLSTTLASILSQEFDGKLPISYSGGATLYTIKDLFDTGIRPITLATDMLKPGGYARMAKMAALLRDHSNTWDKTDISVDKVVALTEKALNDKSLKKDFRGTDKIESGKKLPVTDCYVAPCTVACPIHQDIPEYVRLAGQGYYKEAVDVIYQKNALPYITGSICDHQCQHNCTRLDYEGSVKIREMKLLALRNGFEDYIKTWEKPESVGVKAAVIGAGPAGLSAGYFLARAGYDVDIFEREATAGGIVRNVIPEFRLLESDIENDVEFIKKHGVKIHFNQDPKNLTIKHFKELGYESIFYGIGSEIDNEISIQGDRNKIVASLQYLREYRSGNKMPLGKHVVVIGAGNTAMDCARAAIRQKGVEEVTVVYRRSIKQMPCEFEEYELAVRDGVKFNWLANPVSLNDDGTLVCEKMELGEPDSSGRQRPVSTGENVVIKCDNMITAMSNQVDKEMVTWYGLPTNKWGWPDVNPDTLESIDENGVYVMGDCQSGPQTIVKAIAAATKASNHAIDVFNEKFYAEHPQEHECCGGHDHGEDHECCGQHNHGEDHECTCHNHDDEITLEDAMVSRVSFLEPEALEEFNEEENDYFAELKQNKSTLLPLEAPKKVKAFMEKEANRCMACNAICNKCVEVCPNRANFAVNVKDYMIFEDAYQIVHLDGFCNECGNCGTFCPHEGNPYLDKFTIFSTEFDFKNSKNQGIYKVDDVLHLRWNDEVSELKLVDNSLKESMGDIKTTVLINILLERYSYLFGHLEM